MTFRHFILISEPDRFQMWLNRSVFTAFYKEGRRTYMLFQLYAFYIQVSYPNDEPEDIVFEPFNDTAFLEPYIEHINLDEIFTLIGNK